ncbi:MAG: UDP-2,3-diacylglucosamine hydrolase [Arcobacteraceae bacterium]|jgi:UDP-2,3-diacylglucosamine hydrolase
MIIQNNAIFIADSHHNTKRSQLNNLLTQLKLGHIQSTQIFLMGDIFDFLSEEIEYFKSLNYKIISLINELSRTHEVLYLEGNHDFNLYKIFPNVTVIQRKEQPLFIKQEDKIIALSHGDIFTPKSYDLYTSVIRNRKVLKFVNFLDIKNFFSKFVEKKLMKKNLCHKQDNYLDFVQNRIKSYNSISATDLIIEGHFHQGSISDKYINIPSLVCDNKYMIYQNGQFSFNTL